jgi:hypothetical protein
MQPPAEYVPIHRMSPQTLLVIASKSLIRIFLSAGHESGFVVIGRISVEHGFDIDGKF